MTDAEVNEYIKEVAAKRAVVNRTTFRIEYKLLLAGAEKLKALLNQPDSTYEQRRDAIKLVF